MSSQEYRVSLEDSDQYPIFADSGVVKITVLADNKTDCPECDGKVILRAPSKTETGNIIVCKKCRKS